MNEKIPMSVQFYWCRYQPDMIPDDQGGWVARADFERISATLTARVKELEEENARLRSDLGKSLVALMQENRTQAEDVIDAYRITFDDGPPHAIDWAAALNKEPT